MASGRTNVWPTDPDTVEKLVMALAERVDKLFVESDGPRPAVESASIDTMDLVPRYWESFSARRQPAIGLADYFKVGSVFYGFGVGGHALDCRW